MHLRAIHHFVPPPFFLHREDFLGDAVNLLPEPASATGWGEWIDQRNLSGERFFRPESGTHTVPLPLDGELTLRFRDRSMLPGRLSVLDAEGTLRFTEVLQPSTEWKTFRVELPDAPAKASLLLEIPEGGVWDLEALFLRPLDRAGLREELARRTALPPPANLLPGGCFPLGLPQGWTLERSHSLDRVFQWTERPILGPSGCPALPVTAERAGWIRSPQILPWKDGTHTLSLWVLGQGTLKLAIRSAKRELAQMQIRADENGSAHTLSFIPADGVTPFSVEISWTGEAAFHLDQIRIAPPGAGPEFGERGRAGLALRAEAPDSLFTKGGTLRVRRRVYGNIIPGDTLNWILSDLYGRHLSGTFSLHGADEAEVLWPISDEGLPPLGSYRLEAWITDEDGSVCSGVTEQILHRIPEARTPFGQDCSASAFGAHLLPTRQHLRIAKRLGLNWARLHGPGGEICYWHDVEPEPGTWCFRPDTLKRYREAGFSVLGKLTTAPRWASGQQERVHSYFDMFVSPKDPDAWKTYVRETLKAYGDDVPVYEVWNEPWLDKFFSEAVHRSPEGTAMYTRPDQPVEAYAALCRLAAEAAGETPLIGLNTTTNRGIAGWTDGDEWTRDAEAGGALDPVNILSYHDYNSAADPIRQFSVTRDSFRFALGPLLKKGPLEKPVWNTEGSAQPEGLSSGLYRRLIPEEPESLQIIWEEAERQARSLIAQRVEGVKKIFLYTLHNFHGLGEDNSFTVLLAPDGTPHPIAASFAALARVLDEREVTSCEPVPGGNRITLNNSDGELTQIYLADSAPHLPPPEPGYSPWHDLFGNPVTDEPHGHTFYRTHPPGD
jgi:hypothetical protein